MRLSNIHGAISALVLFLSSPSEAKNHHGLSHLHVLGRKHTHHKRAEASPRAEGIPEIQKRGTCAFPTDAGLVAVTPDAQNAGWAMSPDQPCTFDTYCPYACPPGQVMAQWSPKATSYTYPLSMAGGLYCDANGHVSKPFPNKPYCVDGTGAIGAKNDAEQPVAFCQTVLPGNEAMLIPTAVDNWSKLAVPDTSYWCSTAAHYYINPPGVHVGDACTWSDGTKPIGNWSPYVAGANTDGHGNTFVKVAWNPVYMDSWLQGEKPSFGVRIECEGSGCSGTPCSIDPSKVGIGGVSSAEQAAGAGGAKFCVVTVPKGETANIVVFDTNPSSKDSSSDSSEAAGNAAVASSSASPSPTPTPSPTEATVTSSDAATSASTSTATSESSHATSTTSSSIAESSLTSSSPGSSSRSRTSSSATSASSAAGTAGVFFEQQTVTLSPVAGTASGTILAVKATSAPAFTVNTTTSSSAPENYSSSSIFSFIIVFAVAGYLL